jgi:hypothetical protein
MRLHTRTATVMTAALLATGVATVTGVVGSPAEAATVNTTGDTVHVSLNSTETIVAAQSNPTAHNICRDQVMTALPGLLAVPFDQAWCEWGVHWCAVEATAKNWRTASADFKRVLVLDLTNGWVTYRDTLTCGS